MRTVPVTLAILALLASPAAAAERETISGAAMQPLRDLSVIRQQTPDILKKAAEAPYAAAGDCELMLQEIEDLNAVLGDDIGAVNDDGSTFITSAVKSAVKLPFNSVIRRITGAHKRDEAYEDALMAGVARRAFLKGAMTACTLTPPLVPETVTAPVVAEPEKTQVAAAPVTPSGDTALVVATTP